MFRPGCDRGNATPILSLARHNETPATRTEGADTHKRHRGGSCENRDGCSRVSELVRGVLPSPLVSSNAVLVTTPCLQPARSQPRKTYVVPLLEARRDSSSLCLFDLPSHRARMKCLASTERKMSPHVLRASLSIMAPHRNIIHMIYSTRKHLC